MKKLLGVLAAVMVCAGVLVGCSGDATSKVKGETYDVGEFSVFVPEGWTAIPVADSSSEDPDAVQDNIIQISKGGKDSLDLFNYPYVSVYGYIGESNVLSDPSNLMQYYDKTESWDPITIGDTTWEGFSAENGTGENAIAFDVLWTGDADGNQYEVTLWKDSENGSISVTDEDVQAILASLK